MVRGTITTFCCLLFALPLLAEEPPATVLKSKSLEVLVYSTDFEKGFYRGTRFDWAGIWGQVNFQGHKVFTKWKPNHDPLGHDDVFGPAQEFSSTEPLGYREAKVGEPFLKIGNGDLEKPKEEKYDFTNRYKILNYGERAFQTDEISVRYLHRLKSKTGHHYEYTKKVMIEKDAPNVVWVMHSLLNTGDKTIETDVYNHNFFNVDSDAIGRNYEIALSFKPTITEQKERAKELLKVEGTTLTFTGALDQGTIYAEMTGFPVGKLKDPKKDGYIPDFRMRHLKTGIAVGVWCDQPITKFRLWGTQTALCPEPFLAVKAEPGKRFNWTWRYEFAMGE